MKNLIKLTILFSTLITLNCNAQIYLKTDTILLNNTPNSFIDINGTLLLETTILDGTIKYPMQYFILDSNKWNLLTKEEGMPSDVIHGRYIDNKDNIWFYNFPNGISKFDGNEFTNYPELQGFKPACEDLDGNIWFTNYKNSVCKYDYSNFVFFNKKNGFPFKIVYDIHCDYKGNMWFSSMAKGVARYDGLRYEIFNKKNTGVPLSFGMFFFEDSKKNIWISISRKGIVKYDGEKWEKYSFKEMGGMETVSVNPYISSMYESNDTIYFNHEKFGKYYKTSVFWGGNFYKQFESNKKYTCSKEADGSFSSSEFKYFNNESNKSYFVSKENIEKWYSNKVDSLSLIKNQPTIDSLKKLQISILLEPITNNNIVKSMNELPESLLKTLKMKLFDLKMSTLKWEYQENPILCDELKEIQEYEEIRKIICGSESNNLIVLSPCKKIGNEINDKVLVKVANSDFVNANILIQTDKNGKTWFALGKSLCSVNLQE